MSWNRGWQYSSIVQEQANLAELSQLKLLVKSFPCNRFTFDHLQIQLAQNLIIFHFNHESKQENVEKNFVNYFV